MANNRKQSKSIRILTIILILILCIAFAVFIASISIAYDSKCASIDNIFFRCIWVIVCASFSIYLQLIIHEGGHLIFGMLTGYKFSSFRIGSLMWVKKDGKIHLKRYSLAGTGGQCLMIPPDMIEGKIPIVLYNFGGSILNIISCIVFLCIYILTMNIPFVSTLFFMLSSFGFVFGLLNGIPMKLAFVNNDGYNAIALKKDSTALYAFWLQLKMNEQVSNGVRLKDMPDEWFSLPSDEDMKNSMAATLGVFACNRLMDQKRFAEAYELMNHYLHSNNGIIGIYRNLMICECMYCEMIGENRSEIIDRMFTKELKKFMKSMKKFPSVTRVEYVYALLHEKDQSKASSIMEYFKKHTRKYPYPEEIQGELELIEVSQNRFYQDSPDK